MPVAVNTAMIAASRRAANDLPWQALFRSDSSTLVKTGTAVTVTFGARSRAIGSGSSSSAARHLKNCRSARNWMLAYALLYRSSSCTIHCWISWASACSQLVLPAWPSR